MIFKMIMVDLIFGLVIYFLNKKNFFLKIIYVEFIYFLIYFYLSSVYNIYVDMSIMVMLMILVMIDSLFVFLVMIKLLNCYNLGLMMMKN